MGTVELYGAVSTNVFDYSQQTPSTFIGIVLKGEVELQIIANRFSSENEKYLSYFDT